ncbi:methylated-DNA--[protein]-cysteine S-methyltransferase [Paenisporosarcina sp. TG20]|uniref:methylated-DNA--[protein]-cysteine S-methyltransferase n=1 Tax=Paenisporosarcina sp. TG20 TaxID=1211706 RepID=UPI0002E276F5|nr:methylated-DNA--[protein]-cysteine S-methyltransferase [Paenisporosarcina sp. TG20]
MFTGYIDSAIGIIEVKASNLTLLSVLFVEEKQPSVENNIVKHFTQEIDAYFKGHLTNFTLPLIKGTPFQLQVWDELTQIPYGETSTYSQISQKIQREKAFRAVGTAIGKNKLALVIPCHRVVGKNGEIAGFAWGTWRKEWLLSHEKGLSNKS